MEGAQDRTDRMDYLTYSNPTRQFVHVVVGSQWGDEGKGKIVDRLAQKHPLIARCQGGNNAGHTVVRDGKQYFFHLVPSGLLNEKAQVIIGNGVVVHLPGLFEELDQLELKGVNWKDRVIVSDRCHLVLDYHQKVDMYQENRRKEKKLGTTHKGIGPAYVSKIERTGLRVCDLLGDFGEFTEAYKANLRNLTDAFPELSFHDYVGELDKLRSLAEKLRPMVRDTVHFIRKAIYEEDKTLLVEGANALMLDIDFGSYPYVTSSSCTVGGVLSGLGVPFNSICTVTGVSKVYMTRVGEGPFPTEIIGEVAERLQSIGHEFGVTTGRKRRVGWFDVLVAKYGAIINGYTEMALTKLDVLDNFDEIKIGVSYQVGDKTLTEMPSDPKILKDARVNYITLPGWKTSTKAVKKLKDLPDNALEFIFKIEQLIRVKISFVGVGPDLDDLIRCS